jgi:N-ethylmaleimide reductase
MTTLFDPARFGDIELANRVVMAPLTRMRCPGRVPTALVAAYYVQRVSAGLIVSEAIHVRPDSVGYADTPGIYTPEQVAGWRVVTDAVHAAGGRIVAQLWHVGRMSHSSLQPGGEPPVSSSAVAAQGVMSHTPSGKQPVSVPRALRLDELPGLVDDYRRAARNAIDAGFDGIEVHSANGYLLEQFLRDSINQRGDAYGGAIENRARLTLEVMRAITNEIGGGRSGIRLSPITPANAAPQDSNAQALYTHVATQLAPLKLAFVHIIEGATQGPRDLTAQGVKPFDYAAMRRAFGGPWIVNNGYTRSMALEAVSSGAADAVAFGRPFISNPDLVRRLREDAPWTPVNTKTIYNPGPEGFTDYPTLDQAEA